MAIQNFKSDQFVAASDDWKRTHVRDDHAKLRYQYFEFTNLSGAVGDIGSTIELCKLPPRYVRVLPSQMRFKWSAGGASLTMAIGFRAYSAAADGTLIAESNNELLAATSVASAADKQEPGILLKKDFYSRAGIIVFATFAGAAVPTNFAVSGLIPYLYE